MKRILSCDPGGIGGTSGLALGEFSESQAYTSVATWAVSGDVKGFFRWLDEFQCVWPEPDIVVCEQFIDWNRPGADRTPLRIQGAVEYVYRDVVLQPASGKNTAVPDPVLKRLGLYEDKSHHHDVREARRHAIVYLKHHKHIPTLKAGWGGPEEAK